MTELNLPLPAKISATGSADGKAPPPAPTLSGLLSAIEDGSMTAGGLLAGISVVVTADPNYVALGLTIAAVGKALPSLFESALQSAWGPPYRAELVGTGDRDTWGTVADGFLLGLGAG